MDIEPENLPDYLLQSVGNDYTKDALIDLSESILDGATVTRLNVRDLQKKDATVQLYGLTLRVIRSPKNRRAKEPWYILTNDHQSSRNKIVRIYYHRFEIEETFKDMKHIFEFRRIRLNKPNSLKVLLWLLFLGIALLYVVTKTTKRIVAHRHPKKHISWLRQEMEQLHQACGLVVWGGQGCVGGSDPKG